jgi:hypothetical protein
MNCITYENGKAYVEHELIEIDNHGKPAKVMKLSEQEAKALISKEYGFEFNSIRITGTCWYEATDWNYFLFSVNGWQYEVKDFEALKIV